MESSSYEENYRKYRGKCKQFSEQVVKDDPTLRLVRGYYCCPFTNREEQHWWCEKPDGTIVDPTKLQFLSAGAGTYREFDGTVVCDECGAILQESDAMFQGTHTFCRNTDCYGKYIGAI